MLRPKITNMTPNAFDQVGHQKRA